jgi:hypothetical protein
MRGEDDAHALTDAYDQTLALYRQHFGEPPVGVWTLDDAMKCRRTNCKKQNCTRS